MRLFVRRLDVNPPKPFRFSLGIGGSEGVEMKVEGENCFQQYTSFDHVLCPRSRVLEQRYRLMPDGMLRVACCLKAPGATQDASTQTESNAAPKERGCEKALEDFAKLLESGERSDISLQVGDVEFRVHSAVLCARSPALSVSIRHPCAESATDRIVVEDCDPDVFEAFLLYLYTGSAPSLAGLNVFGLYRIADRYLAEDLKLQCLEHIRNTLSVQTFCDAVRLSLTHGEGDLLQSAVRFATENIHHILRTGEWQSFISECPSQANEILIKCMCP